MNPKLFTIFLSALLASGGSALLATSTPTTIGLASNAGGGSVPLDAPTPQEELEAAISVLTGPSADATCADPKYEETVACQANEVMPCQPLQGTMPPGSCTVPPCDDETTCEALVRDTCDMVTSDDPACDTAIPSGPPCDDEVTCEALVRATCDTATSGDAACDTPIPTIPPCTDEVTCEALVRATCDTATSGDAACQTQVPPQQVVDESDAAQAIASGQGDTYCATDDTGTQACAAYALLTSTAGCDPFKGNLPGDECEAPVPPCDPGAMPTPPGDVCLPDEAAVTGFILETVGDPQAFIAGANDYCDPDDANTETLLCTIHAQVNGTVGNPWSYQENSEAYCGGEGADKPICAVDEAAAQEDPRKYCVGLQGTGAVCYGWRNEEREGTPLLWQIFRSLGKGSLTNTYPGIWIEDSGGNTVTAI